MKVFSILGQMLFWIVNLATSLISKMVQVVAEMLIFAAFRAFCIFAW